MIHFQSSENATITEETEPMPDDVRQLTPARGIARLSRDGQSKKRQASTEVCRVQPLQMVKRQFKDFAVADVDGVKESTMSQIGIAGDIEKSGSVVGIVNPNVSEPTSSSSPVSTTTSVINAAATSSNNYSTSQQNAEIMDIIQVADDDEL